MRPLVSDVSTIVDYSVDKWQMNLIPWALWFCVAGLAICLNTESRNLPGAALAFIYIALLALAFAGWAGTTLIERSGYPFYLVLPVVTLIVFVVVAIIALFGPLGGYHGPRRLWWSHLVNPPINVFGWMLLYLGSGWIAFALFRHVHPARPIISLSPAGLSFNRSWLPDIFIPWQDIHAVGQLVAENPGHAPTIYPHAMAVTVTGEFYAQHIAPKRSILSPPGAERMFRPNGTMMQMVLISPELIVDFEDFRGPIEARWRAFHDQPRTAQPSGSSAGPRHVYGRWLLDGSWWQTLMHISPILGAVIVVLHALDIWPQ
jgi:hypothetical protein